MEISTAVLTRQHAKADGMPQIDKELQDRVSRIFHTSPYHALRQISCEVTDGVPVLRGKVSSFYYKQIAQATALKAVEGKRKIKNHIEVCRS